MEQVLGEWPFERNESAVPAARHQVRQLAQQVLGYGSLSGDVELMAGELLANAVEHGGGEKAHVRVITDGHTVRVEVHDAGNGPSQEAASSPLLAEHGRGLLIVRSFSTGWGMVHDANGTTAWFSIGASGVP